MQVLTKVILCDSVDRYQQLLEEGALICAGDVSNLKYFYSNVEEITKRTMNDPYPQYLQAARSGHSFIVQSINDVRGTIITSFPQWAQSVNLGMTYSLASKEETLGPSHYVMICDAENKELLDEKSKTLTNLQAMDVAPPPTKVLPYKYYPFYEEEEHVYLMCKHWPNMQRTHIVSTLYKTIHCNRGQPTAVMLGPNLNNYRVEEDGTIALLCPTDPIQLFTREDKVKRIWTNTQAQQMRLLRDDEEGWEEIKQKDRHWKDHPAEILEGVKDSTEPCIVHLVEEISGEAKHQQEEYRKLQVTLPLQGDAYENVTQGKSESFFVLKDLRVLEVKSMCKYHTSKQMIRGKGTKT